MQTYLPIMCVCVEKVTVICMEKKEKPIEQQSHRPAAALKFWLTVTQLS